MSGDHDCLLCGAHADTALLLVQWIDPEEMAGKRFDAIPRCRDRQACRGRVEAAGERWLVNDSTKRTLAEDPKRWL